MIRAAALCVAGLLGTLPALAGNLARGSEIYRQHCARCHGDSGRSAWPGAPDLARREGLLQPDRALLESLRRGRGAKPGYRGLLSDTDLLDVIAYSRTLSR